MDPPDWTLRKFKLDFLVCLVLSAIRERPETRHLKNLVGNKKVSLCDIVVRDGLIGHLEIYAGMLGQLGRGEKPGSSYLVTLGVCMYCICRTLG